MHNEELHSLYRSPNIVSTFKYHVSCTDGKISVRINYKLIVTNIVRAIKSGRLRWAGHVARMEEGRSAFKILAGKFIGKKPL